MVSVSSMSKRCCKRRRSLLVGQCGVIEVWDSGDEDDIDCQDGASSCLLFVVSFSGEAKVSKD